MENVFLCVASGNLVLPYYVIGIKKGCYSNVSGQTYLLNST